MVKIVFGGASFMDTGTLGTYSKEQITEAMDLLLDNGVTTIDTARLYQGSEAALGGQQKRTQFAIDTKVPGGFVPGSARKELIVEHAKEALQKVNIEQFDVLYIHAPVSDIPLDDTLAGINEAHKAGIFRRFGLSNYTPEDLDR